MPIGIREELTVTSSMQHGLHRKYRNLLFKNNEIGKENILCMYKCSVIKTVFNVTVIIFHKLKRIKIYIKFHFV